MRTGTQWQNIVSTISHMCDIVDSITITSLLYFLYRKVHIHYMVQPFKSTDHMSSLVDNNIVHNVS